MYRVLEDLCTPQKPSNKSLEEITQLLLEHFKPKHLVVAESFKFYNAKQEEGESISNFLVRLKHLELATANVAHIKKKKETDEVNKMWAESNTFELQKNKMCFGCGRKWQERRSVSNMGKDMF